MAATSVTIDHVTKRFGDFVAVDDVSFDIADGEFFSLLGPSGCGKTTTLRMIAGFEQPDGGQILLRGESVLHLPPFKRNVNTVFQDYALFPHMTVGENVGFSLDIKHVPADERNQRVDQVLEMVHMAEFKPRRPAQLSGGQQQRVALARALVNRPDVLLLDEPLSALDLKLRQAMRLELKALQRQLGITFVFVTHDQEEALFLSDRIAVMDRGKVSQIGSPAEIYDRPSNRYVAAFIGETNFFDCQVLTVEQGRARVRVGDGIEWWVAGDEDIAPGTAGSVITRPEKIDIHATTPADGEHKTVAEGLIVETVWIGTDTHFTIELTGEYLGDGRLQVRHQNMVLGDVVNDLDVGDRVFVSWQQQAARVLTA